MDGVDNIARVKNTFEMLLTSSICALGNSAAIDDVLGDVLISRVCPRATIISFGDEGLLFESPVSSGR
jgi:hypothetical protein